MIRPPGPPLPARKAQALRKASAYTIPMKTPTLLAAAWLLLPCARLAAAPDPLAEAFSTAAAAARADLCAENKALEARSFGFELQPNKLSPGISLRFTYGSCRVDGHTATRVYSSAEGYQLALATPDGAEWTAATIARPGGAPAFAGGSHPTKDFLGSIQFDGASLTTTSGKTLFGAASLWSETPASDAPKQQE